MCFATINIPSSLGFLVHLMDTLIETSRPLATAVESKHSAAVQTDASGEGSESHNTKPSVGM